MRKDFSARYSALKSPEHGGASLPSGLIDFSISVNPFPLPSSAAAAYTEAWSGIGLYPDTECRELKRAAEKHLKLCPEELVVTNGSAEAFQIIASAMLGPGCKSLVLSPGYCDYAHVSKLAGAEVVTHRLLADEGFRVRPDRLLAEIRDIQPEVTWLCSPNNPTGVTIEDRLIEKVADAAAEYGGTLVVDRAYAAYSEDGFGESIGFGKHGNILTVRSLTKDFGIPGLRLGWVQAPRNIAGILQLAKPCWSVNFPAQAVGAALLGELDYFKDCWKKSAILRRDLAAGLNQAGITIDEEVFGCGIFVFFKDPIEGSGISFGESVLRHGVRLRDCTSMGAPGYFRAGVRLTEDNEFLVRAVHNVLAARGE